VPVVLALAAGIYVLHRRRQRRVAARAAYTATSEAAARRSAAPYGRPGQVLRSPDVAKGGRHAHGSSVASILGPDTPSSAGMLGSPASYGVPVAPPRSANSAYFNTANPMWS
jgi:hypothetical protein